MSADLWKKGRGVNRQVGPRKLIGGEEPHDLWEDRKGVGHCDVLKSLVYFLMKRVMKTTVYVKHWSFFKYQLDYNTHTIKFTISKCTIQWFLVYTQNYAIDTTIKFQNIFITLKTDPILISSHSPVTATTQPLATDNLLSVSIDLPILDIPYQQIHVIYGHLCLAT